MSRDFGAEALVLWREWYRQAKGNPIADDSDYPTCFFCQNLQRGDLPNHEQDCLFGPVRKMLEDYEISLSQGSSMTLVEWIWWPTHPKVTEGAEVQCPKCGAWSPYDAWEYTEIPCSECNHSHPTAVCPKCDARIDHVHSPIFNTRLTEKVQN